jgi:hypothetical protein
VWALRFLVGHAYLLEFFSLARLVLVVSVSNALRQSADLVQLFDSFKTEELHEILRLGRARQRHIGQLVARFAGRLQCNVSTVQSINRVQININEVTPVSLPLVCVVLRIVFSLKASVS